MHNRCKSNVGTKPCRGRLVDMGAVNRTADCDRCQLRHRFDNAAGWVADILA